MTQTRYGSPLNLLDVRGGAGHGEVAHRCSNGPVAENAPFTWLDDHRLLVVTLPQDKLSAAIDQFVRPYRALARDADRIGQGALPTVKGVASGTARTDWDIPAPEAVLRIIDTQTGRDRTLATVPAYPFQGGLTVSVSPDGTRAAVLVTIRAFQPSAGRPIPNLSADGWAVERRLGFVPLDADGGVQWATMPAAARYPLELYGWSPNGRRVALRGRSDPFTDETPVFVADASTGSVQQVGAESIGQQFATAADPHPAAVYWIDNQSIAARSRDGKWWLMRTAAPARAIEVPDGATPPDSLVRTRRESLAALVDGRLLRLDPSRGAFVSVAQLGKDAWFLLPRDPGPALRFRLIVLHRSDDSWVMATMDTGSGIITHSIPAFTADLLDMGADNAALLYSRAKPDGLDLRLANLAGGPDRTLLTLNAYLRDVDWGETRLVTYQTADGAKLNASMILPPGYVTGRRYPTLVWVYGGYRVPADLRGDHMSGTAMPGFYNLHLYAAQGYVVLIPSIPLGGNGNQKDVYRQLPDGVLPAVDRLVAMGIADPNRVGVFGQSFGGYAVEALIGQTDRFRAAVAMAGISDLVTNYGQFDPNSWSYPGIAHEKSDNAETGYLFGLTAPPWKDMQSYIRNSPLAYVDRVDTPLLLIHGDMDIRGAPTQAELFFYSLYKQGKTAELLRYGGESHSLAQSPANVRDVVARTLAWFDRYLERPESEAAGGVASKH
ncbi:S9 family peptidase [Stakelama marina]|nr:prolyl oligopeptidase family serine peptidase [Stakelama marina]